MSRISHSLLMYRFSEGDISRLRVSQSPFFWIPALQKSNCISKSPILRRYRSFCFSRASSSCFGDSKASAEFSMNSFFQRLIITGDKSYLTARSFNVSRSFMAYIATFALNLASYFFLILFMVLSYFFLTL